MKSPFEITIKINVAFLTKRFKEPEVQVDIQERLYSLGVVVLRSLGLRETYYIKDMALGGVEPASFIAVATSGEVESDVVEAVIYAAPYNLLKGAQDDLK